MITQINILKNKNIIPLLDGIIFFNLLIITNFLAYSLRLGLDISGEATFFDSTIFQVVLSLAYYLIIKCIKTNIRWFILPILFFFVGIIFYNINDSMGYGIEALFLLCSLSSGVFIFVFSDGIEFIFSIILILWIPLFLVVITFLSIFISKKIVKVMLQTLTIDKQ